MMKKLFSLVVACATLSSVNLFAFGSSSLGTVSEEGKWQTAFDLYARIVGSVGHSEDKGTKTHSVASMRIRPGFIATNGNLTFGAQLGVDYYIGNSTSSNYTVHNGSNVTGFGMGYNTLLQLRRLYIGYAWDNGLYTVAGAQDASLPYLLSNNAAGLVIGWKNDKLDVTTFYYQLSTGSIYDYSEDAGLFGIAFNATPIEGLTIAPYLAGLWQGGTAGGDTGVTYTYDNTGAIFQHNVGMYLGGNISYATSFGLNFSTNMVWAFGNNKDGSVTASNNTQLRNAFGILLNLDYTYEDMMKADLFFDYRMGNSHPNNNKHNTSINDAVLEYDATTPPLYILYNYSASRAGYQYLPGDDGYAFTPYGAMTIGGDFNYTLGPIDLGVALGYGMTAVKSGGSTALGFEVDAKAGYKIVQGLEAFVEGGVLIPGNVVKNLAPRSATPWLTNFVLQYSL